MEEKGGSVATVQLWEAKRNTNVNNWKKNPGRQFWGCEGRNLYENKSTRMQCLKIKV